MTDKDVDRIIGKKLYRMKTFCRTYSWVFKSRNCLCEKMKNAGYSLSIYMGYRAPGDPMTYDCRFHDSHAVLVGKCTSEDILKAVCHAAAEALETVGKMALLGGK